MVVSARLYTRQNPLWIVLPCKQTTCSSQKFKQIEILQGKNFVRAWKRNAICILYCKLKGFLPGLFPKTSNAVQLIWGLLMQNLGLCYQVSDIISPQILKIQCPLPVLALFDFDTRIWISEERIKKIKTSALICDSRYFAFYFPHFPSFEYRSTGKLSLIIKVFRWKYLFPLWFPYRNYCSCNLILQSNSKSQVLGTKNNPLSSFGENFSVL